MNGQDGPGSKIQALEIRLRALDNHFVQQLGYFSLEGNDQFQLILSPMGGFSPILLMATGVKYLLVEAPSDIQGALFLGSVNLVRLPESGPWPADIAKLVGRATDWPDLIYLNMETTNGVIVIICQVLDLSAS